MSASIVCGVDGSADSQARGVQKLRQRSVAGRFEAGAFESPSESGEDRNGLAGEYLTSTRWI